MVKGAGVFRGRKKISEWPKEDITSKRIQQAIALLMIVLKRDLAQVKQQLETKGVIFVRAPWRKVIDYYWYNESTLYIILPDEAEAKDIAYVILEAVYYPEFTENKNLDRPWQVKAAAFIERSGGDAWVAFLDIQKLSDRNYVYGREVVDKILIRTVIEAAHAVTDRLGGLTFHISGDEIVVLLPPAMKQDEIYDALNRVQLNIMEQVQGRYVLAKLNAASARSKRAGLKKLSRYSRFVMTANLLVKTGSVVTEETFVVLGKKIHETNEAVLKEVLSVLEKSRVTVEIETDVLVPWAPAGAVKISQIPDISHLSIVNKIEPAKTEAEYTQRLAKETKELVRVGLSPRPTSAPMQLAGDGRRLEKERKKIRIQMLQAGIPLEAMEEVWPAIRREHVVDIINSAWKATEAAVNIVRGPPDAFYIVLTQENFFVKVIKVCPYYIPLSTEKETAFIAASGSRGYRRVKDSNGERLHFGFKVINDTLDHNSGDEVILALNVAFQHI